MLNLFDLRGRTALVTGSSRGIGLAIAQSMAEAGARVVITSRNQIDCDAAAQGINDVHGAGRAIAYAADVGNKQALERLVERSRQALGPIDILVGNAANNPHFGTLATITDDQLRAVLNDNLMANHWLAQFVAPDMIAKRDGSIILVSSIGGFSGSDLIGAYNISKAALMQLVRNLAVELGKHNVRVNGIAPGTVRTELARPLWGDPEREAERARGTALGRIAEPGELAGAAVFLASKAGSFTTGQTIVVDGGRLIKS